jgi:hypothetical protein
MDITTTLQPKYTFRMFAIAIVSLVLGLWGVYDYVVVIPHKARAYNWNQLSERVKQALEVTPGSPAAQDRIDEARAVLEFELERIRADLPEPEEGATLDPEQVREWIRTENREQTLAVLAVFAAAVTEADRRSTSTPLTPTYQVAHEVAKGIINETGEVSPPGRFDRATQWFFMLCLPCVPWFLWSWWKAKRRVHRLDDDGTLHGPGGEAWSRDQIAGIDMSRWMSKSVVHVEHADGRRMKLDDYVHRNVHRIAGAIASERHPDEWDTEGKPKTREEDGAEATA